VRTARDPLRRRRGAGRHREDGADLGDRALRHRSGPDRFGKVARRRSTARRRDRPDKADGRCSARRPRRDLRREPPRLRSGDRGPPRGRKRRVPQASRRARRPHPYAPRAARGAQCGRRGGSRARPDARTRAGRPDAGAREVGDLGRTRPRPRPAVLRYLRERDSHPRAPHDRRCAPRARPGSAGGIAWQ
jgi:hypothetical protein